MTDFHPSFGEECGPGVAGQAAPRLLFFPNGTAPGRRCEGVGGRHSHLLLKVTPETEDSLEHRRKCCPGGALAWRGRKEGAGVSTRCRCAGEGRSRVGRYRSRDTRMHLASKRVSSWAGEAGLAPSGTGPDIWEGVYLGDPVRAKVMPSKDLHRRLG